ncbi:MAG: hypothetical protein NWR72_19275 [Bacteroidia bacterium]|nr:hypothetical protein [Bacteroidia bacterium]
MLKILSQVWILSWCLCAGPLLLSQELTFTHLAGAEGLSNGTVYDIIEDRWGFLWVATRYGLYRYDGYSFELYEAGAGGDNRSRRIFALYEDKDGNIWAGYRDGGILILDRSEERFRIFRPANEASVNWTSMTVRRFFEDSQGQLWLGTNGQGAIVLGPDHEVVMKLGVDEAPAHMIGSNFPVDFTEDPSGNVWIGTSGQGVYLYDPHLDHTKAFHQMELGSPDMESFEKSLLWDKRGYLWVGATGSGLYRLSPESGEVKHFEKKGGKLASDLVTDLMMEDNQTIWITTDGGGLNILDLETEEIRVVSHVPGVIESLNSNALYDLFKDRSGNIWVGTFNSGINLYHARKPYFWLIHPLSSRFSFGGRSVLSMVVDSAGVIWAGTDGKGLLRYDPNTKQEQYFTTHNSHVGGNVVTSVALTNNGNLWLGYFGDGLSLFQPATPTSATLRFRPGDSPRQQIENVWDILIDQNDGLWLATLGEGLKYLRQGELHFRQFLPSYDSDASLSDWVLMDIMEARSGLIWIATESQGLCSYDPADDLFRRYQYREDDSNSIRNNHLRSLFEDRDGNIWIGTEGSGLICFLPKEDRFLQYSQSDGLPSDLVESINQDLNGLIWVSTNRGLASISPESGDIRSYSLEDGLQNNPFNPKSTLRLSDGTLLFGSLNGILAFNPNKPYLPPTPPPTVLTGFQIFNQQVASGVYLEDRLWEGTLNDSAASIRISYRENSFSFAFSGIAPAMPQNIRYAYRLDGFEPEWQYVEANHRYATYTNLGPGSYRFEVKSAHSNGKWGESRIVTLEITPPFWKTIWFRILSTLLAISTMVAVMRQILIRQEERNRNRIREAEKEILRLQNEKLEQEVSSKKERLSAVLLQTAHKNEILMNIKNLVEESTDFVGMRRQLLGSIDRELKEEDYWEQFQLNFDDTHQEFIRQLRQLHPTLTPTEVRLSSFIRMHLSNREIAAIMSITLSGVEKGKFRMKKKIGLPKEADLNAYLVDL